MFFYVFEIIPENEKAFKEYMEAFPNSQKN